MKHLIALVFEVETTDDSNFDMVAASLELEMSALAEGMCSHKRIFDQFGPNSDPECRCTFLDQQLLGLKLFEIRNEKTGISW